MPITIITTGLDDDHTIDAISNMFSTARGRVGMNRAGGRAVQQMLKAHHMGMARDRKWDNPDLPTHGRGRKSTRFGTAIARAWSAPEATQDYAEVTNTDPRLALKVYGGTIKPKKAKYLTVPVTPSAHGRTVAQWVSRNPKRKLFKPRGRLFLAYKLKTTGALRPVYLLRKFVRFKKWPNAMPADSAIADAFWNEGVSKHMDRVIARQSKDDFKRRKDAPD